MIAALALLALQAPEEPELYKLSGHLVPLDSTPIRLEPVAWDGDFEVEEIAPHGVMVEEGQVLARFRTSDFERKMEKLEHQLEDLRLDTDLANLRHELHTRTETRQLIDAELAVLRAEEDLAWWLEYQLEQARNQAELSRQYTEHALQDAEDELVQLEAMYTDDELTDATEEIVLRRSRRDLDRSRFAASLSQAQAMFTREFIWPRTTRDKEKAVDHAQRHLDSLLNTREVKKMEHHIHLVRQERKMADIVRQLEEMRLDRELLVLRAPRAGMFLHGSFDSARQGGQRRYRRGDSMAAKTEVLRIADPASLGVLVKMSPRRLDLEAEVKVFFQHREESAVTATLTEVPRRSHLYLQGDTWYEVRLDSLPRGWEEAMRVQVGVQPLTDQ